MLCLTCIISIVLFIVACTLNHASAATKNTQFEPEYRHITEGREPGTHRWLHVTSLSVNERRKKDAGIPITWKATPNPRAFLG